MKAWTVDDGGYGDYGTAIVFAETRGKAKALCYHSDTFEDVEWNYLRVRRFPKYDQYYDGRAWVDFWKDEEHRVRLVRDFGWSCVEPIDSECKECPAKRWCKGEEE